MREPDQEIERLAHDVNGAAIEVHREIGPGFQESVYEEALCIEMTARQIPFLTQHIIAVPYKGIRVGEGRADYFAGNRLVVELKAIDLLTERERAQVLSYLRAVKQPLGLLLNFNVDQLRHGNQACRSE